MCSSPVTLGGGCASTYDGPWIVGVRGVEPLALPGLLPAGLHPARVVQRLHLGRHGAPSLRRRQRPPGCISGSGRSRTSPRPARTPTATRPSSTRVLHESSPSPPTRVTTSKPQRQGDEDARLFLDLPRDQPLHGSGAPVDRVSRGRSTACSCRGQAGALRRPRPARPRWPSCGRRARPRRCSARCLRRR